MKAETGEARSWELGVGRILFPLLNGAQGVAMYMSMNKVLRTSNASTHTVVRSGMPRWRSAQAALPPGRKLEMIEKLILQTRQLESIKRHATRL